MISSSELEKDKEELAWQMAHMIVSQVTTRSHSINLFLSSLLTSIFNQACEHSLSKYPSLDNANFHIFEIDLHIHMLIYVMKGMVEQDL